MCGKATRLTYLWTRSKVKYLTVAFIPWSNGSCDSVQKWYFFSSLKQLVKVIKVDDMGAVVDLINMPHCEIIKGANYLD